MAWPIDGRSRQAPTRSADAMSEQEFSERIIETVVRTRLEMDANYPFPDLDQAQARVFHATHLGYFSFFAWEFPSWLMSIASRCPYQDVRAEIIEDCVDEEVGDIDAGGRCHIDVLYDEVEVCGMSRDEVCALEASPVLAAAINGLDTLARNYSWEIGYAAMSALEMGSTTQAVELRNKILAETMTEEEIAHTRSARESNSLSARTGLPPEQLAFAALHAYKDQFHGGGGLALLVKYGVTRQIQDDMLWAIKRSIQTFMVMREETDRLARAAVGLGPRVKTYIAEPV